MTLEVFRGDKIKSFILTIVIGGPIYFAFMKIIIWGGKDFYLYLMIFTITLLIIMINLIPNVIMPLFNKYEDLEDGSLKNAIHDLARDLKFPLTKIYKVDASKRSSHSNAFYYGFGSNKRIVLFDTLI
jgi:STE24 endopeptidase